MDDRGDATHAASYANRDPGGTPSQWEEEGAHDIRDRAHDKVREILSTHYPDHIDAATDAKVRERFPIQIPPEAMRPGNGRW